MGDLKRIKDSRFAAKVIMTMRGIKGEGTASRGRQNHGGGSRVPNGWPAKGVQIHTLFFRRAAEEDTSSPA